MKILVTGSHFTPAQATIEELKSYQDIHIIYIGRKHTMEGDKTLSVESQVLPKLGVKFISLTTGRVRRSFDFLTFWSLLKIPFGFIQALIIVARENPDVILSFGGYVAVPVVVSGWLLSKKIIVHEQTLVSGLANKVTSIFADKIAVSFNSKYEFDNSKVVLTGNPMRRELLDTPKVSSEIERVFKDMKEEKLPLVFITGGNQGSYTINRCVLEILDELIKSCFVIHQSGDSKYGDFELLDKKRETLKFPHRYLVRKWIGDEFGEIVKMASLVVSRSGANTLTELAFFNIPALVIPLPGLYKNEQMVNAKFFEKSGLVSVLPQSELSGRKLIEKIKKMLKEEEILKERALGAKKLVVLDAARRLAQETILLGQKDV